MSDRAPDNMSTEILRGMVSYAEEQCSEWTRSINYHNEMLEVAERAYHHWEQQVIELQQQLDNRLMEESTNV